MTNDTVATEEGLSKLFPKGDPNDAYAQFFIGQSYLAPLGDSQLGASNVTFEPGCRNNWHIHHKGGQVLICVAGRGWYQEWGKAPQELHSGRCCEYSAGGEALAWCCCRLLVPAYCIGGYLLRAQAQNGLSR